MVLTNAERQSRWREKQRKENRPLYLERARRRQREKYIPVVLLGELVANKRREDTNRRVRKCRTQQKTDNPEPFTRSSKGKTNPLVVNLPAVLKAGRAAGVRKTYNKALKKAYRKIEELSDKNADLLCGRWKLQKKVDRLAKAAADDSPPSETETVPLTPRSRTKVQLSRAGISAQKHRTIRKRLLLANSLTDDIRNAIKGKKTSSIKLSCAIIKKYRCVSSLGKSVGVTRQTIARLVQKKTLKKKQNALDAQVREFYEREDNSSILPGKKDTKKVGSETEQKRVLSDYVHNLHLKFLAENPTTKISITQFYRLRPPHMLLCCYTSRKTCLCSRHQNMSLKLRGLRAAGLKFSKNRDVFVKDHDTNETVQTELKEKLPEHVHFTVWKKVVINESGKSKWKEVDTTMTKNEFIPLMLEELSEFRDHVRRVKIQYQQVKVLRENLPKNEVLVWMDFAENYTCTSYEEPQSAYWNASMVSLHTMVVYYPKESRNELQSYVAISGVLSHNATAVYTIMRKLVPALKDENPELKKIHYLTDSPTSQYRNKTIFNILADYDTDVGVEARWNYLEAGHGKGPCDGLGASVKRAADMSVKRGKQSIQDECDFVVWAQATGNSGSKVKYIDYTQSDYDIASGILLNKDAVQSVPGTFKLHVAVPVGNMQIATRETSCNCDNCLTDVTTSSCEGWELHSLNKKKTVPSSNSKIE